MKSHKILLRYHGQFEQKCFGKIADDILREFGTQVEIMEWHSDISVFFDPTRHQYNANLLLRHIDSINNGDALKTIAIFRVDLFIPILTYIFGQAAYKGKTGVVSIYRLKNEQYGLSPDNNLLTERLRKVVIHELGHTFGLIHCQNPECVMRSSTYVEDIDQKKLKFCKKCREQLSAEL